MSTSREIRRQFIDFFVSKHGHTFVPSAPVVPQDDPTLLFTNAGMNQFKPIFLGLEKRAYVRAANSQKCIRAGGKHNDLDDVGRSPRHHTFFEMLGNWSFGDYFKRGAIEMAWELLTGVWKLDPRRLHVSIYKGARDVPADEEAGELWKEIAGLKDDHIHRFGADNFWEMGETGPCGPCSEIFYDRTPNISGGPHVGTSHPLVMEIWNLVFIQYNRDSDGKLSRLPASHVDTGMGLERICQVLQDKSDNYATDLFTPLFTALSAQCGGTYHGTFNAGEHLQRDIAYRVITDHARMATFAITDGAIPSNKKRGAVLRSVIRRAVRFGYQDLGLRKPFLYKLVDVLAAQMGADFPELLRQPQQVARIIETEEADFLVNIERGLAAFEEAAERAKSAGGSFSGEDIFFLHSTLGFPADMTMQLASQRGLKPQVEAYDKLDEEFRRTSGVGRTTHATTAVDLTALGRSDDALKYGELSASATILGWVVDSKAVTQGRLDEDAAAALVLDRTNFYAEQGGQVGDVGTIRTATGLFEVSSTQRLGDWVLHWGTVAEGHIEAAQAATAQVDARRIDTMRNHTSTHLLNWALREVLGEHIEQKGSLVDAQKLRFDFSHPQAIDAAQLQRIERLVNEHIYADESVSATLMPLSEAKKLPGVRAVFGEKYPDPVRVIAIGTSDPRQHAGRENSIEFCGGTHLGRTGQAGFFKIISEESVSKNVRRIIARTGAGAVTYVQELDAGLRQIAQALSAPATEAPQRIAALQEEIRQLKKKQHSGVPAADPTAVAAKLLAGAEAVGAGSLVVGEVPGAGEEQLRTAMDWLKKKIPSYAILLAAVEEEKVSFVAAVSDDLIALGLKAGDWVREAAKVTGGGGGGRPQMAQAGGKDAAKVPAALQHGAEFARAALKRQA